MALMSLAPIILFVDNTFNRVQARAMFCSTNSRKAMVTEGLRDGPVSSAHPIGTCSRIYFGV